MRRPHTDPEFEALIPPLTDEEAAQLEANLLAARQCRDPLVVWKERGILVDGHHRLRICTRRDIPYQVEELSFTDRDAVKLWIAANQLGRRNLHPHAMSYLRGLLYNAAKQQGQRTDLAGTCGQSGDKLKGGTCGQSGHKLKTRDLFGDKYGVSSRSIARDAEFANAVEQLKAVKPDIVASLVAGTIPSREAVLRAAENPDRAGALLDFHPHVLNNSGNYEWYTPAPIVEAARTTMAGIDLDPASTALANETVKAKRFFTIEQDGLQQEWHGRIWLNPPYTRGIIDNFARKLVEEFAAGRTTHACVIVNNATETQWFHAILEAAAALCLIKGRIPFTNPEGNTDEDAKGLQGQVGFYLGSQGPLTRYVTAWGKLGKVVQLKR